MAILAEEMIRREFLKAKWVADKERQDEAQNKLDLYRDDYEEIVREKIKELFHKDNYDRLYYHVNQSQNILKRVINEISTVYKAQPVREFGKDERYQEILDYSKLDTKLKKINRYTNLLNETLIKIGVRGGRIVYDIITPNIATIIQNEQDPTQADAIIYMVTRKNTVGDDKIAYYYWDVYGNHIVLDKDFRISFIIYDEAAAQGSLEFYPYRDDEGRSVLPFVIFHREEPDDSFWDQDSGRDLYNAALMTGIKMTLFDYYFKVASFKQPYVTGDVVSIPSKQILDPLTVFQVTGEGANVGLLDMQVNMDQLKDALVFQINSIINNYGISADQWSLSISEVSGRALKIRNRALLEIRQEQIPLYREYEQEIFDKTRVVNNAHFPDRQIKSAEFSVDFGEIEFPEDPEEELRLDTKRLKMGLISLGQLYKKYNPDVDEKGGEKIIIENLEKLKALREEHPTLDEALNFIMRQDWQRSQENIKQQEGK
jgi:hypothetical protein